MITYLILFLSTVTNLVFANVIATKDLDTVSPPLSSSQSGHHFALVCMDRDRTNFCRKAPYQYYCKSNGDLDKIGPILHRSCDIFCACRYLGTSHHCLTVPGGISTCLPDATTDKVTEVPDAITGGGTITSSGDLFSKPVQSLSVHPRIAGPQYSGKEPITMLANVNPVKENIPFTDHGFPASSTRSMVTASSKTPSPFLGPGRGPKATSNIPVQPESLETRTSSFNFGEATTVLSSSSLPSRLPSAPTTSLEKRHNYGFVCRTAIGAIDRDLYYKCVSSKYGNYCDSLGKIKHSGRSWPFCELDCACQQVADFVPSSPGGFGFQTCYGILTGSLCLEVDGEANTTAARTLALSSWSTASLIVSQATPASSSETGAMSGRANTPNVDTSSTNSMSLASPSVAVGARALSSFDIVSTGDRSAMNPKNGWETVTKRSKQPT